MAQHKKYTDALDNILDRPIAFNPSFKRITGSTNAGLLLSQGFYWSKRTNDPEGWFWKTRAEWMDETGLTEDELDGARAKCRDTGVMEEKLKGVPATLFYRVNKPKVYELLGVQFPEKSETEIPETPETGIPGNSEIPEKQESGNSGNINKESETTPVITTKGGLSETENQEANAFVDAIIAFQKTPALKYLNRDKMPEPYLPMCDFYVQLIGKDGNGDWIQEPTKRVLMEWMGAFEDWKQERLTREHIRAAWERANSPDGGFPVSGPHALTKTAVAMKTKLLSKGNSSPALDEKRVNETIKAQEEKFSQTFVPRPESVPAPAIVKNRMQELALQKSQARKGVSYGG